MNQLAPTPETALMLFRTQRLDTRQIAIKLGLFTTRPSSRRIKGPGPYPDEAAALKLIHEGPVEGAHERAARAGVRPMSDLAQHMAGVAREILGEPNRHLSSEGRELRWGSGGSVSVDVRKGTVFDHELNEGGGVLWLIEQRLGLKGRDAFEWMSEHGFRVDAHADTRPRRQEPQRPAPKPEPQARAPKPEPGGEWAFLGLSADTKLVRTYDYTNEAGELLYQVCRFEWPNPEKATGYDKTFRQRRPDASKRSGWAWNLEGIKHGLYRLTELHEALAEDATVFLAEGEKDVETLTELGVPATTNSGGAKHWGADHAAAFKDADVVLLIDNDAAGRARVDVVAGSLNGIARRIRVLDLAKHWPAMPDKGDVTDWAKFAGGTADQLTSSRPTPRPGAPASTASRASSAWCCGATWRSQRIPSNT